MRGYLWEEGPANGSGSEKSYFLTTNLLPRSDVMTSQHAPAGTFFASGGGISPRGNSTAVSRRPIPAVSLVDHPARVIRTHPTSGFHHRRIFFGGFFPFGFFPGAYFADCFGFGFDYGYGFGYPYDPCGYGYFYPGYGYYPAGSYYNFTGNVYTDTNDMGPYGEPSEDDAVAPPGAPAPAPGPDVTVLYLKDGSSYGVTDYWLENNRLHYVTTYGGANAIDLDELDLQRTVDENAIQGVKFTLRPPHWKDQEAQPAPNQPPANVQTPQQ